MQSIVYTINYLWLVVPVMPHRHRLPLCFPQYLKCPTPPCEVDVMPWGTSVHSLETTEYKFYPQLTPTTQKVKNVIPLPLHRNVREGLLWDIKGQKQIRIGRQDPPSNFHQPLRARSKPLKQGLQLMEEPIISCSGRNCLSPSGRKHWGILEKLAANI